VPVEGVVDESLSEPVAVEDVLDESTSEPVAVEDVLDESLAADDEASEDAEDVGDPVEPSPVVDSPGPGVNAAHPRSPAHEVAITRRRAIATLPLGLGAVRSTITARISVGSIASRAPSRAARLMPWSASPTRSSGTSPDAYVVLGAHGLLRVAGPLTSHSAGTRELSTAHRNAGIIYATRTAVPSLGPGTVVIEVAVLRAD
jgi:hypothetical protein